MTLLDPAPDTDVAVAFFDALYRDVDHGWITLFSAKAGGTRVDWFPASSIDGLAARAIARSNQQADVWFGVATRHEQLPAGRGGADDCHQITGLWLDIDVAGPHHKNSEGLPPTLDDAYRILDRFEIAPSLVVESGGGLQPWWLLSEPVGVDPELLRRWHQTWARIADETGGWRIDNVSDPARVMRVPGTLNRKVPGDPAPVTIVDATDTRHALGDIAELLDDTPPPPARQPAATTYNGDDPRPGDEFNAAHSGNDVLSAAGWHHHRDLANGTAWRRPGKPDPRTIHSAIVYDDGHICSYSDTVADTRLEKHRSYDPWGAHVAINHGGDWGAAARVWRQDHPGRPPAEDWSAFDDLLDPDDGSGPTLPIPAAIDDATMAAAFAAYIEGRFLYCAQLGGWFAWDGRRWRRDHAKAARETCRRWILTLGQQMFRSDVDTDRIRKIVSYKHKARIEAVVELASGIDGIVADSHEFDQHPDLLCARNGVIDLRTGALTSFNPALRLTRLTDVDYRPDAHHSDVQAVLEVIESDVRTWLQTMFGYAATGHVREDVMPVFDGTGSNGKTTLLAAVSAALGEHAKAAPDKLLMDAGNEHPTLIADLFGRRLVYIEETAEGGSLKVERMKALTGGGELSARYMRQDYFTFQPTHQIIIATNHRPAVNSTEHATWRRLRLIPFPHRYTSENEARPGDRIIDRGLRHRLTAGEGQREATLAWVVAGAIRWHRTGLEHCPTIASATDAWRLSEDVILRFIEDRCELGTGCSARSSELHSEYTKWCEHEGRPSSSNKEFTKRIEAHDVSEQLEFRKTRNGAVWFGIGVNDAI